MIAAVGLLLGVLAGLVFAPDVPLGLERYLPIAVVAEKVGYAQAAAFSTAFRQHFGVTPKYVRQR